MSLSRFLIGVFVCCLVETHATDAKDSSLDNFERDVRPVLAALCYQCHGDEKREGDIRFDTLDPDLLNGSDSETWNDALDQLNQNEMPPARAPQPTAEQRQLLTQWMVASLHNAAEAKRAKQGRVTTRRLTRYEYDNTMRDLLLLEMSFADDLPPDAASHEGFLNNGATLEMSPTQIEQYLAVARQALSEAIVTGEQPRVYEFSQTRSATGKFPTREFAGHEPVRPEFVLDLSEYPRRGPFELRIQARAAIPPGEGLPRIRVSMGNVPGIIHVPRAEIGDADVIEKSTTFTFRGRMEDFPQPGPISFGNSGFEGMVVMIDFVDADGNELRYPDRQYVEPNTGSKKKKGAAKIDLARDETDDKVNEPAQGAAPTKATLPTQGSASVPFGERLEIEVTSVEFTAPSYACWPPPSHQNIFVSSDQSSDESRYIRHILRRFMESAFRRPVREAEVAKIAKLFEEIRVESDSFEDAVRETLAAVLVSPHFLYIVEQRDAHVAPQFVNAFELASRLSYLLWSSCPDRELIKLAQQDKLIEVDVLKQQVRRLLADEKSSEFIKHFVTQWLDLDGLDRVAVNPEFFPEFEDDLKQQMKNETLAYFEQVFRSDMSALELLDSDWAMLNRRLAHHYSLDGPTSTSFQRVVLPPGNPRGGLLGQASFLLANANGEDSHPIKRAVWILDRLLDAPPSPPPADVPELDPESPDSAKMTLKQQLEMHRSKESCGNCHREIDPWGIPLENFDAVGVWRTEIAPIKTRPKSDIDAASILPSGIEIDGAAELKRYLKETQHERFARAIVKRLMTYGLGRSLDFSDRQAVDALTQGFVENEYRLKSLLIDFVCSDVFRSK